MDGVTTFDWVRINKHVLQILRLDGYDQLAADVNKSGNVTTFDIVQLRKLILHIIPDLSPAYDQPWRFIRETVTIPNFYDFDGGNDDNPFQYTNLDGEDQYLLAANQQGFDAVKLGDVNNSNSESEFSGNGGGTLMGEPIYVDIIKHVSNGVSTYDFKVQDFENIVAYQMDIEFPEADLQLTATQALDLEGVIPDFFGTTKATSEGLIKTLWSDEATASAHSLSDGAGIFRLVFNGTTSQLLNDVHLSNNMGFRASGEKSSIKNFAYLPDGTVRPIIQREFSQGEIVAISANPNPFTNSIVLDVEAEKESVVDILLVNAMGQILSEHKEAINSETNRIEIGNLENLAGGIYFVHFYSNGNTIVKKLIKN